jgi:LEM3 (ligand-effect modulator 3) family / CDC50 family
MDLNSNLSLAGSVLNPDEIALPCGLIAKYYFNDTYTMHKTNDSTQTIFIDETNIAIQSDKHHKFKT